MLILVSSATEIALSLPAFARLRHVRLEQDARLRQQFRRAFDRAHEKFKPGVFLNLCRRAWRGIAVKKYVVRLSNGERERPNQ